MPAAVIETKAVIFDLDDVLLDRAPAWQYALEEGVAMTLGQRLDAAPFVAEYLRRPWRDVLAIIVGDPGLRTRCEGACRAIYARGGQKRLLVHDGLGMALDWIRSARIEMGAISREPQPLAVKQLQSTGIDRFLAVLATPAPGEPWDAAERVAQCLNFLGRSPAECVFVSADVFDLDRLEERGACGIFAAWAGRGGGSHPALTTPAMLGPALLAKRLPGD